MYKWSVCTSGVYVQVECMYKWSICTSGVYVQVHPCSLRHVQIMPEENVSSEKEKENDKDCETSCSQDITDDYDFIPAPNTSNAGNLTIDPDEGIDSACAKSSQLGSTDVSEEGISCNPKQAENPTKLNGKVPAKGTKIHH